MSDSARPAADAAEGRGTPETPAGVIETLGAQCVVFQELESLARAQRALIEQDAMDGLIDLMRQRQALIEEAERLGAALGPARERWSAVLGGASEAERARVSELADRVDALLSSIAEADREGERLLGARREALSIELGGLSRGRSASNAYAGGGHRGPRYQDRRA